MPLLALHRARLGGLARLLLVLVLLQGVKDALGLVLQPQRHSSSSCCWLWQWRRRQRACLLACGMLLLLLLLIVHRALLLQLRHLLRLCVGSTHCRCRCSRGLLVWLLGLQLAPLHALLAPLHHNGVRGGRGTMHQQHLGRQPPALGSEAPHPAAHSARAHTRG
jgi:hypothetical protein